MTRTPNITTGSSDAVEKSFSNEYSLRFNMYHFVPNRKSRHTWSCNEQCIHQHEAASCLCHGYQRFWVQE